MTTLCFAQISDIHISSRGDHDDLLSGRSAGFLADILARLSRLEELDFVLITGDLFDSAVQAEFDRFQQIMQSLKKPYYVIPGNHDRRPVDSTEGLTRHELARYFNPQFEARPTAIAAAQVGYWSIEVDPQVQLIGLDSVKDEDWGGVVDSIQVEWLRHELAKHARKIIIIAIHHPLQPLAPIDAEPRWRRFLCENGSEISALLDKFPQVKLVLSGHHHLTKVDHLGQRLHISSPSIAIYPCAFRLLRLTSQADGGWKLAWQLRPAADDETIAEARELMIKSWLDVGFETRFVEEHVSIAFGTDYDRNGSAII